MSHALSWASAGFGFLAAALWFLATKARVVYHERADPKTGMIGAAITENGIDVIETAKQQTWWNMWAAIATSVSVAFQAISLLCQN